MPPDNHFSYKRKKESCIEQARDTREIDASNKHMTHQGLHSNDQ